MDKRIHVSLNTASMPVVYFVPGKVIPGEIHAFVAHELIGDEIGLARLSQELDERNRSENWTDQFRLPLVDLETLRAIEVAPYKSGP